MQAVRTFTLKRTSSWQTHRLPDRRPSSTCGRWALVSTCLPVNTSLSPPPSNPAKRQILSYESSLKSSHRRSECVLIFEIAPTNFNSVIVYSPSCYFCPISKLNFSTGSGQRFHTFINTIQSITYALLRWCNYFLLSYFLLYCMEKKENWIWNDIRISTFYSVTTFTFFLKGSWMTRFQLTWRMR